MLTGRLAAYGAVALFIVALIGGGWLEVRHIVTQNAELTAKAASLEQALDIQRHATDAAVQSAKQQADARAAEEVALEAVRRTADEATAQLRSLQATFAKHDLAAIAQRHPSVLERHINDATARVDRLLEQASGGGAGAAQPPTSGAAPTAAPATGPPH